MKILARLAVWLLTGWIVVPPFLAAIHSVFELRQSVLDREKQTRKQTDGRLGLYPWRQEVGRERQVVEESRGPIRQTVSVIPNDAKAKP